MLLHCSFNFLFCVVSVLCMMSLLCGESFNMNKCVETEKQALLKFKKDALFFESDRLSSWKGEDCCKWEGISCDNFTRHVTSLNLFEYELGGKLDSSICELQHLSSLNLGGCYLEGKIPKCIRSLGKLIELNLTYNNLVGVIPPSMRELSNLQTLDLSNNKIVGDIPSSPRNLSNLQTLDLSGNNLVGVIPSFLTNLSNLQTLGLSGNKLVGVIPSSLRNIFNLQTLDLSNNNLVGVIPSFLTNLSNLQTLGLSGNKLVGVIPSSLRNLFNLQTLDLSNNNLVGVIPSSLRNLSNLQTLTLSYNYYMISNDLEWISHLSNLRYLDLSSLNLNLAVDWMSSISKIPSLSELHLEYCELQVTPKSIPHLNSSISLKSLSLGGNSFKSSILPWVVNVSKVLTHLDLSYNELQGSIPKTFKSMCQLEDLHLKSNKLSGQLSDNIQQLCCAKNSTLEYLDMSDNAFVSGSLPDVSCFSSLMTLNLRNTNIVGLLPKYVVHWSSYLDLDLSHNHLHGVDIIDDAYQSTLSGLDLSYNQLSGSMPLFEITKIASLQKLDLSHNQLSGPFPHTIGQLSRLYELSLSTNMLNGVINENHLSNLSQLVTLDVAQNSLSFNFSSDWVPPFKLEVLYASSCPLGPTFPAWLKHHDELMNLDISNTSISDSFPKWFWNLSSNFQYLNVSHNQLSGPLPKSFPLSTKVTYGGMLAWDFSFNRLNGSLPPFPQLMAIFLSNNRFIGSLSSFCTSSSHILMYLDLSSNLLAGQLSDCWRKFERLVVLNLANNNFSGKLPNSLGSLQEIESLHLNSNNFSGKIPSLILCLNLNLIDIGDNNLQGTIPVWIGHHLGNLVVLRIRANKFHGHIPTSMCNLSFLQVLDISINNITGEIPQCFGNMLLALSNLMLTRINFWDFSYTIGYAELLGYAIGSITDKAVLALKGSYREYETNLRFMTTIDLSCNHLTGEIPQSITKLVALIGLNLSGNNLTGFIPNNIGHMQSLESLDLSSNHLHGKMPTSFSNLTFLSFMNLSFNHLEGKIPLSTQLQSFDPSSFVGNDRLCGPPLINICPVDAISPTSHGKHVTDEDDDKLVTFGFYVSLGIGFFVGFWGVCGTLVIKTSWRHVYFKFFKNVNDWIHVTIAVFVNRLKRRFQVKE